MANHFASFFHIVISCSQIPLQGGLWVASVHVLIQTPRWEENLDQKLWGQQ